MKASRSSSVNAYIGLVHLLEPERKSVALDQTAQSWFWPSRAVRNPGSGIKQGYQKLERIFHFIFLLCFSVSNCCVCKRGVVLVADLFDEDA